MHRSMAAGADVLDVDIRMTSDGVIVGGIVRGAANLPGWA